MCVGTISNQEKIRVYDKGVDPRMAGVYDLLVSYRSGDVVAQSGWYWRSSESSVFHVHHQQQDASQ
jgi:hypothetical protein